MSPTNISSTTTHYRELPGVRVGLLPSITRLIERVTSGFEKNGDTVRVTGLPVRVICTRDPIICKQILIHPQTGASKPTWLLPRVRQVMQSGAYADVGGFQWKAKRTAVQPVFTHDAIEPYLATSKMIVRRHTDGWKILADTEATFDIYYKLQLLVVDLAFSLFFSHELGADLEQVRESTHTIESDFARAMPSWIPLRSNYFFEKSRRYLTEVMSVIVRKRMGRPNSDPRDMIDVLLLARSMNSDPRHMTRNIVGEMFSVYFGASVMSATLTWLITLLAQNVAWQARIAVDATAIDEDDFTRLARLRSSELAVKECVRLFPASWVYPRVAQNKSELGGIAIRRGTILLPMIYHLHRHPTIWPKPDNFAPERFEGQEARTAEGGYLPFGAGPRKCAGAVIAPPIMQLIIGYLVRLFEFQLAAPEQEFKPRFGFEIMPPEAVNVRIRHRRSCVLDNSATKPEFHANSVCSKPE